MVKHPVLGLMLMSLCMTAHAETQKRVGGDAQNSQAQMLLQQIALERDKAVSEKIALQKQIDKLTADLEASEAQQKKLKKKLSSTSGALDKYKGNSSALSEKLADTRAQMKELIDKFRETIGNLKMVESQKMTLEDRLAGREAELKQCSEHNVQLYGVNQNLIEQYQNKGVIDTVRGNEPVLGFGRVEMENIAQAYQDKIDELRFRVELERQ